MTSRSRYRCFFCGNGFRKWSDCADHFFATHRKLIEARIQPLESFPDLGDPEEN